MLNEKQIIELTKKTGMIEAIDYQYRTRDKASREEMKKRETKWFSSETSHIKVLSVIRSDRAF